MAHEMDQQRDDPSVHNSRQGSGESEIKEGVANGQDVEKISSRASGKDGVGRRVWRVVSWTPKRCRWDPADPPRFNMGLNLLFGFVSCAVFLFV